MTNLLRQYISTEWRMVQDLNLWLFCNNISLAKKLNKPL
nr:MAG TPA: hypothetical protein [Caudoviricetes sp.]